MALGFLIRGALTMSTTSKRKKMKKVKRKKEMIQGKDIYKGKEKLGEKVEQQCKKRRIRTRAKCKSGKKKGKE